MIKHVHQVLPSFSHRDAVGSDTLLIRNHLRDLGFESEIFHELTGEESTSMPLSKLSPYFNRQDTACLFHFSIGSDFPGQFAHLSNRKMVRYHNVTPPEFFCAPAEAHIRNACVRGRQQIPMLSVFCDLVIGDSAYNSQEFSQFSSVPTEVVPIFRDYDKLKSLPDSKEFQHILTQSSKPILLFVGRICPNKAQHDLLKMLALYKATFNDPVSLVLVGSFFSPAFKTEIENYARYLGLTITHDIKAIAHADVVIAGSISDEQMASIYRHSTLFCSLSDHEGFGVPLVEAMSFGLPVMAHSAAAVPETLKRAGALVEKKDWPGVVTTLRSLLLSSERRKLLSNHGLQRAAELSLTKAQKQLEKVLKDHHIL